MRSTQRNILRDKLAIATYTYIWKTMSHTYYFLLHKLFLQVIVNICRWGRTVSSDLLEFCLPDKATALYRASHNVVQRTYQIESMNLSETISNSASCGTSPFIFKV
jgi:hypothetical protein